MNSYPPTDDCKDESTTQDSVHQQWCTHTTWENPWHRWHTWLLFFWVRGTGNRTCWEGWVGMCCPGCQTVLPGVDEGTPKSESCGLPARKPLQNQKPTDTGFNLCTGRFLQGITEPRNFLLKKEKPKVKIWKNKCNWYFTFSPLTPFWPGKPATPGNPASPWF